MTKRWQSPLFVPLALLTLLSAPVFGAAQGKQEPEAPSEAPQAGKLKEPPLRTHHNRYEIRYLDLHSAEQLAWDLCSFRDSCRVTASSMEGKSGGILEVEADTATQEKIARELARRDVVPKTQTFHLLLLTGSTQAGALPKDLSAGAQKALNDLKGFLPYKSYQLLDSTLVPATRGAGASARLVGKADAAYTLRLAFDSGGLGKEEQIFVSRFYLTEDPGSTPFVPGSGSTQRRIPHDLLNTTFALKPGETIVVGTSRIDGSEDALVVLLTAIK